MKLTWQDSEQVASALVMRYPGTDPLSLTGEQLHNFVVGLPEFGDDPAAGSVDLIEAIQAAWYDKFES
jgi:FeS assembly protein IscX